MITKHMGQQSTGRKKRGNLLTVAFLAQLIFILFFTAGMAGAQDGLNHLKAETLSYFRPVKGKVLSVSGSEIVSDLGLKSGVRIGMRLSVIREGAPFLHPVTKEPIGKTETQTGTAVVRKVDADSSVMQVITGNAGQGDILKISGMAVRMLFYQDRTIDWEVADTYYRMLKESGRFVLVDTALDAAEDAAVIAEARKLNAGFALVLRAEESPDKGTIIRQRLFWTDDSSMLAEEKVSMDAAFAKDIKFGAESIGLQQTAGADALISAEVPAGARLITTGDVDGDGKQELILSSGRYIKISALDTALQSIYEIKTPVSDDHLWIDAVDINNDGRDEVLVTSMRDNEIFSYIYSMKGQEFSILWEGRLFLRKFKNTIAAQAYDKSEGFDGPVFILAFESGSFRKGSVLKIPSGVNIYDFMYMDGADGSILLAYDEAGYLNLYDKTGLRIWQSKEDYGRFLNTFKKASPTVMTDRGDWAIKDRLFLRNKEAVVIKRIPLANMVRGLGYRKSQVSALWWTGLSMEEKNILDNLSGGILDYAIAGNKLIILSKTLFGITPKKILKGENPFVNMLHVYSLKGK